MIILYIYHDQPNPSLMKIIISLLLLLTSFMSIGQSFKGAWKAQTATNSTSTMIIADNYLTIASFSLRDKFFDRTEGGPFTINGDQMTYTPEYNTTDTAKIGKPIVYKITREGSILTMDAESPLVWSLIDEAEKVPMAGTWHITERAQDGTGPLVKIHQTGTRKTLKILSGTKFQWVAIDPAVKGFYGTGGGTYTIKNGTYTEQIEFFSRDNHRVGASLSFGWKLNEGKWDHSGKSSKGDPIHETWEK